MKQTIWDYFLIKAPSVPRLPEWFRALMMVIAIICVGSLLFCLLIICALLIRLGIDALSMSSPTYQDATRNFLFAFASAFGAPFLVWRAWVAHQQAKAALEQAHIAVESHVTGIFSKSVELMGYMRQAERAKPDGTYEIRSVPNIEARLGAIYSLERVMRESLKDRVAVLETLCAYVRENSPIEVSDDPEKAAAFLRGDDPPKPTRRKDVQAALTVIGRRPKDAISDLDLRATNLVAYDFAVLNFDAANFSGSFLNGANMVGGSFSHCIFTKTFMRAANIRVADFTSSIFQDCDFKNAEIDGTKFTTSRFINTDLREASVKSMNIEGANFEMAFGYGLEYAVESIKKDGANFSNAQEINSTGQLFAKATYDGSTSVSQAVREAIILTTPPPKAEASQQV